MDAVASEQLRQQENQSSVSKEIILLMQAMSDLSFTPKFSREDILAGIDPQSANERDALAIEKTRKLTVDWIEPASGYTRLYAPRRTSTIESGKPPGLWYTNYEWRARQGKETVAPKSDGGGKLFYVDIPTNKIADWIQHEEHIGNLTIQHIIVDREIASQSKLLTEPVLKLTIATESGLGKTTEATHGT